MAGASSLRISALCLALVISASPGARADEATDTPPALERLDDPEPAATEPAPELPPTPAPEPTAELQAPEPTPAETPEIEAKAYDIQVVRPSRSGRVYLLQKQDSDLPPDGKLFLLRDGATPVMAFRVLKTYPSQSRIAAKKLRAYPGYDRLANGSAYRAFEKIGDKAVAPAPTREDLKDIQELETAPTDEAAPPPPESGSGAPENLPATEPSPEPSPPASETNPPETEETPPPPAEAPPAEAAPAPAPGAGEFSESDQNLEILDDEAEESIETAYPNQVTMEAGLLPNSSVPGPALKFGGGLRYGRNLSPEWAVEGAMFYYKTGDTDLGVNLTVLSFIGTARRQWKLNAICDVYLYGGLLFPYVASNVGATTDQLSAAQKLSLALGGGLLLQTGPNWYLRVNLGTDAMTAGVMLRY